MLKFSHPRTSAIRTLGTVACLALLALSASAASGQKVIAKLGQTIRDVGIHSRMSPTAHVFYQSKQYEYLAVNHTKSPKWFSVILQNGGHGYVPSDAVALLPYNVMQQAPKPERDMRGYMASRGGSAPPPSGVSGVANYALSFVGSTPYKWGGTEIGTGIDCSGFVQKMFGTIGMNLPRTAAEQERVGTPITRLEYLQAGDRLYFWEKSRGKIGHTGIYLGNGYFVHSSSGKGGISTSKLTAGWIKILVAARRS